MPLKIPQIRNPWLSLIVSVLGSMAFSLWMAKDDGNFSLQDILDASKTLETLDLYWFTKSNPLILALPAWINLASPFRQDTAITATVDLPEAPKEPKL